MGVVILLFSVGLEVRTDDLLKVGKPALLTAVVGMVLPMAGGFGLAAVLGGDPLESFFVGLALAATSSWCWASPSHAARAASRPQRSRGPCSPTRRSSRRS